MALRSGQTPYSLDFFRRRLASVDALPQLCILALAAGLITGGVIIAFNTAVTWALAHLLTGGPEDFESLGAFGRMWLPTIGGLAIGCALWRIPRSGTRVGVVHVMERLSRHQGRLPLRNALVQFFGGIAALISGQAGGREGPAIHLGAASSSLLGQLFELPNNSVRTLVACGSAAAIAAAFNTPIAGVIFAMEVVMMEYTIASFLPVILAAVTSTFVTHSVLGNETAFVVPQLQLTSLAEIPYIVLAGVMIGCLASLFTYLVQLFSRLNHWSFPMRGLVAGAITGVAALLTPGVMGIGYDTVNGALLGSVAVHTLCLLVITKMLAATACLGLGLPLGVIGPALFIGASFGGVLGLLGQAVAPADVSSPGLYVMLGMSAMMAAVLQAPLAALMAVLELTANPGVIPPAMLIIVVATLITGEVFKRRSVFVTTLKTLGLEYPPSPVAMHLQRAGVASIMHRNFIRLPRIVTRQEAENALGRAPRWIVVEESANTAHCLLNPSDLGAFIAEFDSGDEGRVETRSGARVDGKTTPKAVDGSAEQPPRDGAESKPSTGANSAPTGEAPTTANTPGSKPGETAENRDGDQPHAEAIDGSGARRAARTGTQAAGTQTAADDGTADNTSTKDGDSERPKDSPRERRREARREAKREATEGRIDLLRIPGQREDVVNVDIRATLQEALEALDDNSVRALCVRRTSIPLVAPIMGVLTREDINNFRR
ncbi:MAG: chloride channel protein [Pseudomonadota bacterium]